MTQNTSSAVMQQRHEARDSLDDFPTPPWATRALCNKIIPWDIGDGATVWEPACNRGHMADPLAEYFRRVYRTDVHDYSAEYSEQESVCDFLISGTEPQVIQAQGVDWIITNPPFRLAEQFAFRAMDVARHGVAMFVRSAFLEGCGRHERLFSIRPPSIVAQFCERVPLIKGRYDPKASTATAYCWLVWVKDKVGDYEGWGAGRDGTRFTWIAPCRKELERPSDSLTLEEAEKL